MMGAEACCKPYLLHRKMLIEHNFSSVVELNFDHSILVGDVSVDTRAIDCGFKDTDDLGKLLLCKRQEYLLIHV